MSLSDIKGQETALRSISNFARSGRIPHALLFHGPGGCGKHTTAVAFAQAVNCPETGPGEDACGRCRSCRRVAKGIDLDVITYQPGRLGYRKEAAIEIRKEAVTTPHSAGRKFLILDNSDMMNPESANLMLKIFEEPPAFTTFIFISQNVDRIIPTIRSRALPVPFKPVSTDDAALIAGDRLDPETVRFLHPLAKGDMGLMFKLAEDDEINTMFRELAKTIRGRLENEAVVSPSLAAGELSALASKIDLSTSDDTPSTAERKSVIFMLEAMLIFLDRRFSETARNNGAQKELKTLCALFESVLGTIKAVKGGGHTLLSLETLAIEYRRAAGF